MRLYRVQLKNALLALALLFSASAAADGSVNVRYALVLGGGDSSAGPGTQFDASAKTLAGKLKSAGYISSALFDGGHSETDSMIASLYGAQGGPFTNAETQALLRQIISGIKNGKMHRGDQLLIDIDSHGAPPDPTGLHWVETSYGPGFDVGSLTALRDAAEQAGVHLAVIDASCYSGATLALSSSKTCVITAAPADQVGDQSTAENLNNALKPGLSLESSYLQSRLADPYGFPEISTYAGQEAADVLSLIDSQIIIDSSDPQNLPTNTVACELENDTPFYSQLKLLTGLLPALYGAPPDSVQDLFQKVYQYKHLREMMLEDTTYLTKKVIINGIPFELAQLLDPNQTIASSKNLLKQPNITEKTIDFVQSMIKALPAMESKRAELMQSDPHFRQILDGEQMMPFGELERPKKLVQLSQAAEAVAQSERLIYNALYQRYSDERPNPCRDFKF
ncbi:MAG: hypothetical protein P4M08_13820 [Oligoflexia bacterium]|nr:hypothetical protein [Oligoflexia bacterium]